MRAAHCPPHLHPELRVLESRLGQIVELRRDECLKWSPHVYEEYAGLIKPTDFAEIWWNRSKSNLKIWWFTIHNFKFSKNIKKSGENTIKTRENSMHSGEEFFSNQQCLLD
jgi:hypothetical protein